MYRTQMGSDVVCPEEEEDERKGRDRQAGRIQNGLHVGGKSDPFVWIVSRRVFQSSGECSQQMGRVQGIECKSTVAIIESPGIVGSFGGIHTVQKSRVIQRWESIPGSDSPNEADRIVQRVGDTIAVIVIETNKMVNRRCRAGVPSRTGGD